MNADGRDGVTAESYRRRNGFDEGARAVRDVEGKMRVTTRGAAGAARPR